MGKVMRKKKFIYETCGCWCVCALCFYTHEYPNVDTLFWHSISHRVAMVPIISNLLLLYLCWMWINKCSQWKLMTSGKYSKLIDVHSMKKITLFFFDLVFSNWSVYFVIYKIMECQTISQNFRRIKFKNNSSNINH